MAQPGTQDSSARSSRSSLRRQIRAFGVLFVVTIVLACGFAVELVRHSDAARIADAHRQLQHATAQLQALYINRVRNDNRALTSITSAVLAGMPGVEGGFYFTHDSQLLGYAFPTYQGTGPKSDVPGAERPTILAVARRAVATGRAAEKRIDTASDTILFSASPIAAERAPIGAVWAMHHLQGVHGAYQPLSAGVLLLLLIVSGAATAGAWQLTRRLDAGVSKIESGLAAMEYRLESDIAPTGIDELDRIAAAIGHLGKAFDLTQRRRAELEQKLRHADRLSALGRLVAAVAHELRNPLASIKLKLHLAARAGSSDPQRLANDFAVLTSEVDRIDRLVERLLALGKPAAATHQRLDVARYIAQRLEAFAPPASARGIALELVPSPSLNGNLVAERDRLGQVVDNLIANALDATPAGGKIVIEAEHDERRRHLVIRVKDSGAGVAPSIRDRLFEPFTTTKESGMGLGLFVSAEIVRGLGGEIAYREDGVNADGRRAAGACFEVRLPC
jgi:signal transduction histidine kinase